MKKLCLQLAVVAILALALIGLPMLIYTQPLRAVPLTPVKRNLQIQQPLQQSKLIWFQRSDANKFIGISSKQPLNSDSKIYLAAIKGSNYFYDTGDTYLVGPNSDLSAFIGKHQTGLGAKEVFITYSTGDRYQVVSHPDRALEFSKTNGSKQITFVHLPEATYQAILQQGRLNPTFGELIVKADPNTHDITLDPTAQKLDAKLWLKKTWDYLKSSIHNAPH